MGTGRAAHFSSESVLLTVSATASASAPLAPMLLSNKLHTRAGQKCQRLLTVWVMARGGSLERGERRVDPERLGEALCALGSDLVVVEAVQTGAGQKCQRLLTLWAGWSGQRTAAP